MTLGCYDGTEHSKDLNVSIICFIARKVAVTTLFKFKVSIRPTGFS